MNYIGRFVVPEVVVELTEEEKLAEAKRQEKLEKSEQVTANIWHEKRRSEESVGRNRSGESKGSRAIIIVNLRL